jgi:hypothetical protein
MTYSAAPSRPEADGWPPAPMTERCICDDGGELFVLRGRDHWILGVAWSPKRRQLATASRDRAVRIWHGDNGSQLLLLHGHEDGAKLVSRAGVNGCSVCHSPEPRVPALRRGDFGSWRPCYVAEWRSRFSRALFSIHCSRRVAVEISGVVCCCASVRLWGSTSRPPAVSGSSSCP